MRALVAALPLVAAGSARADDASAAALCADTGACSPPPARRALGVSLERLFGQTWVERRVQTPVGVNEQRFDSFDVFAVRTPREGYGAPRVAADYLFDFGLTLGGAIGYHAVQRGDASASAWLFAPRAGYFWQFSRRLALWPRAGLTWLALDVDGAGYSENERAVTLELPLVFLLARERLGLLLQPYVDLGLPGGDVELDERGVQLGVTVFF